MPVIPASPLVGSAVILPVRPCSGFSCSPHPQNQQKVSKEAAGIWPGVVAGPGEGGSQDQRKHKGKSQSFLVAGQAKWPGIFGTFTHMPLKKGIAFRQGQDVLSRMQRRCYSGQVRPAPSMATKQASPTLIVDTWALRSSCREEPWRGEKSWKCSKKKPQLGHIILSFTTLLVNMVIPFLQMSKLRVHTSSGDDSWA